MTWKTLVAVFKQAAKQDREAAEYQKLLKSPLDYRVLQRVADMVSRQSITVRVGPFKDQSTGGETWIEMSSKPQAQRLAGVAERIRAENDLLRQS